MDYQWNNAFQFIIKLKRTYQNKIGVISNYDIRQWIEELNLPEYNDFMQRVTLSCFDEMVLIKYSMINVGPDMWKDRNSMYREMRSLTIDLKNEAIVLLPFRKFFNIDEVEETKYDVLLEKIKNAKCIEIADKMDGSMQSARYYNGKIIMSGSQALDPQNSVRLTEGISWLNDNYQKMITENEQYTFNFEYISMGDQHVVQYKKEDEGLYLIGMRNVYTGEQLPYSKVKEYANRYNVKMTKLEEGTLDDLIYKSKTIQSDKKEGWVLYIDDMLVKLKCEQYIQIHKVLNKLSSINVVIKAIADGYYDDLLVKVPEIYRHRIDSAAKLVYEYVNNTEKEISELYMKIPKSEKKTRKDFAIYIQQNIPKKYQNYMWAKYDNKEYNVLKSNSKAQQPKYITMKEMGYNTNYSALFGEE